MEKWDYERIAAAFEAIQVLYIEWLIEYEEKVEMESMLWERSGWTKDAVMEECEKRILGEENDN